MQDMASYGQVTFPGRGQGLVAVRRIAVGELIMKEEPDIEVDTEAWDTDPGIGVAKFTAVQRKHLENFKGPGRDWVPLLNERGKWSEDAYLATFDNNCFTADSDDEEDSKLVVFNDITLINHSCSPNVAQAWKDYGFSISGRTQLVSGCMEIRARTNIAAGTELLLDYQWSREWPKRAERRQSLRPYGFVCHCTICQMLSPCRKSEANRTLLQHYIDVERPILRSYGTSERLMIVKCYVARVEFELGLVQDATPSIRMDERLAEAYVAILGCLLHAVLELTKTGMLILQELTEPIKTYAQPCSTSERRVMSCDVWMGLVLVNTVQRFAGF